MFAVPYSNLRSVLVKPVRFTIGCVDREVRRLRYSSALSLSGREPKEEISADNATEVLDNVISLVVYQRQIERRNIIISAVSVTSVVLLIFLIDLMQWEAFVFVCMPFIFLGIGIVLIALSIHRRRMKLSYYVTLILGIFALLFPVVICLLLLFAFALGGPIAN